MCGALRPHKQQQAQSSKRGSRVLYSGGETGGLGKIGCWATSNSNPPEGFASLYARWPRGPNVMACFCHIRWAFRPETKKKKPLSETLDTRRVLFNLVWQTEGRLEKTLSASELPRLESLFSRCLMRADSQGGEPPCSDWWACRNKFFSQGPQNLQYEAVGVVAGISCSVVLPDDVSGFSSLHPS